MVTAGDRQRYNEQLQYYLNDVRYGGAQRMPAPIAEPGTRHIITREEVRDHRFGLDAILDAIIAERFPGRDVIIQRDFTTDNFVVIARAEYDRALQGAIQRDREQGAAFNAGWVNVRLFGGGAGTIADGYEHEMLREARTQKWVPGTKQLAMIGANNVAEEYRDAEGRFHREDGPAIVGRRGERYYFWHGLDCADYWLMQRARLTPEYVSETIAQNHNFVRVLSELYIGEPVRRGWEGLDGPKRLIHDHPNTRIVDINIGVGTLKKLTIGDEVLAAVEVKNATIEPDGSVKKFYMRVPPETRTALEGIAWTFGLSPKQYKPIAQS